MYRPNHWKRHVLISEKQKPTRLRLPREILINENKRKFFLMYQANRMDNRSGSFRTFIEPKAAFYKKKKKKKVGHSSFNDLPALRSPKFIIISPSTRNRGRRYKDRKTKQKNRRCFSSKIYTMGLQLTWQWYLQLTWQCPSSLQAINRHPKTMEYDDGCPCLVH